MTPKEKANELVHEFVINMPIPFHIEDAKICASIAVDEIETVLLQERVFESLNYWQEVKQEILKL
jgi:hypothetical protein